MKLFASLALVGLGSAAAYGAKDFVKDVKDSHFSAKAFEEKEITETKKAEDDAKVAYDAKKDDAGLKKTLVESRGKHRLAKLRKSMDDELKTLDSKLEGKMKGFHDFIMESETKADECTNKADISQISTDNAAAVKKYTDEWEVLDDAKDKKKAGELKTEIETRIAKVAEFFGKDDNKKCKAKTEMVKLAADHIQLSNIVKQIIAEYKLETKTDGKNGGGEGGKNDKKGGELDTWHIVLIIAVVLLSGICLFLVLRK